MRMILAVLILLIGSFLSWWFWEVPIPSRPKPVAITIPDSRISDLELKVKNLENWAQKQGMKY